ncbi:MAG: cyclic nucleotide-binding domain-containing protein [Proteobacteria bacterium]|nr:MAG: cyclic nucleotide-binding domain-containing protein [Pseudomonadota bacterium]
MAKWRLSISRKRYGTEARNQRMNEKVEEFLETVSLFNGVPSETLARVAELGRLVDCDPGEVLIGEGDPHNKIIVVVDGEVQILLRDPSDETRPLRLATCGPRSVIGEMSLVDPQVSQSVVRTSSTARIFMLRYGVLQDMVDENPALGVVMLKNQLRTITQRLRKETAEFLSYSQVLG